MAKLIIMTGVNCSELMILQETEKELNENQEDKRLFLHFVDESEDFDQTKFNKCKLSDIIFGTLLLILSDKFYFYDYASDYFSFYLKDFQKIGLFIEGNAPSSDTLRNLFMVLDPKKVKDKIIDTFDKLLERINFITNEDFNMFDSEYPLEIFNLTGMKVSKDAMNFTEESSESTEKNVILIDEMNFLYRNEIKLMNALNNIAFSFFRIAKSLYPEKTGNYVRILISDKPNEVFKTMIPLIENKQVNQLLRLNLKGRKPKIL